MAHFARLNEAGIVLQVIVVNDTDILDDAGNESEQLGIALCRRIFGQETIWVQTSYSNKSRGQFASIGDQYDPGQDVFISPPSMPERL